MNKTKLMVIGLIALGIIVVALIILALTGKLTNNTKTADNTIRITYWGLWEPESVMAPIIAKYETDHPGVKIDYTQKTFTQYESTLYTRLVQGATDDKPVPDIFRVHNTWLPKYQNYLSPMPTSVMSVSDYTKTFYPTVSNDFIGSDGKAYGMPLMIDGLALFLQQEIAAGGRNYSASNRLGHIS